MDKYFRCLCFDSLPDLIILMTGTYYDMVDMDKEFYNGKDSSFNSDRFVLWAMKRRTVKICAQTKGRLFLSVAASEKLRINNRAKLARCFLTEKELREDLNSGKLIPFENRI